MKNTIVRKTKCPSRKALAEAMVWVGGLRNCDRSGLSYAQIHMLTLADALAASEASEAELKTRLIP